MFDTSSWHSVSQHTSWRQSCELEGSSEPRLSLSSGAHIWKTAEHDDTKRCQPVSTKSALINCLRMQVNYQHDYTCISCMYIHVAYMYIYTYRYISISVWLVPRRSLILDRSSSASRTSAASLRSSWSTPAASASRYASFNKRPDGHLESKSNLSISQ